MRAVVLTRHGRARDVLALRDEPEPRAPGAGEVRVRVHAVGLNPVDLKTREGEPKPLLPFAVPFVLGVDLSGLIEEVGANVSRLRVGDEVFAYTGMDRMGALADVVVLAADRVARAPRALSHAQRACLPLPGLCALTALDAGGVDRGHKVLVHGGGGAVGSLAIQLASRRGAEVIATASARDAERVRALGAATVIDYRLERFEEHVREADFVLDTVGGDTLTRSFSVVKPGGTVASLHVPPPAEALLSASLRAPWWLRLALPLVTYAPRASARRAAARLVPLLTVPSHEGLSRICEESERSGLAVEIDRAFELADAIDALDHLESGKARGRVVVTLRREERAAA